MLSLVICYRSTGSMSEFDFSQQGFQSLQSKADHHDYHENKATVDASISPNAYDDLYGPEFYKEYGIAPSEYDGLYETELSGDDSGYQIDGNPPPRFGKNVPPVDPGPAIILSRYEKGLLLLSIQRFLLSYASRHDGEICPFSRLPFSFSFVRSKRTRRLQPLRLPSA